jgi:hypothetical protein
LSSARVCQLVDPKSGLVPVRFRLKTVADVGVEPSTTRKLACDGAPKSIRMPATVWLFGSTSPVSR